MAEAKTKPTPMSPDAFIAAVENPQRREDARLVADLMARLSGEPAVMWGPSIIGYGRYRYQYDSGRSGEMCRIGFSPRKANLVLYLISGFAAHDALLARLGKHRTGASCLYVNRLGDIDLDILEQLIRGALDEMDRRYPREAAALS
ncbi:MULTISPECIES: DUF1801 domain-containing protein [unclassified Sphingomonas]|jgi:hypothetical protein|uniref:DUF1801 domain-containing protein n=1 Tax=unclassified Sphingomonas TaxID=196159 RepID=UPI000833C0CB|nr:MULTISPECIES: DUF1801 domain-containing protein [unclassified Sphingomonas]